MKGLMELSSSLLYIIRNADILENLEISCALGIIVFVVENFESHLVGRFVVVELVTQHAYSHLPPVVY